MWWSLLTAKVQALCTRARVKLLHHQPDHVVWSGLLRNQLVSVFRFVRCDVAVEALARPVSVLQSPRRTGPYGDLTVTSVKTAALNSPYLLFLFVRIQHYLPEPAEMIKNGHHATEQDEAGCSEPVRSPEKRKRVVRLWCDGWWVSVPAADLLSVVGLLNASIFCCPIQSHM